MPVNVSNRNPEAALFDTGALNRFEIGSPADVGTTGEFRDIVGNAFRANDLLPLLNEVLYGGGVDGVALNTIDDDTVTLELTNARGVADVVVLDDVGDAVAALALGAVVVGNAQPEFALFDLGAGDTIRVGSTGDVGSTGEFAGIVGRSFQANDVPALLSELLYGDGVDGVTINTLDDDSLTLELRGDGGATDTVALDGVGAILDLALGFVDAGDDLAQFAYFDVDAGNAIRIENADEVGGLGAVVGGEVEPGELAALFGAILEGGIEGVELISVDDDSLTVALTNADGATDVVLFDNASSVLSDILA